MRNEFTASDAILPGYLARSVNNDRIRNVHRTLHPHRGIPGMMPADIGTSIQRAGEEGVAPLDVHAWLIAQTGHVSVTANCPWGGQPVDGAVIELASGEIVAPAAGWWRDRAAWKKAQVPT